MNPLIKTLIICRPYVALAIHLADISPKCYFYLNLILNHLRFNFINKLMIKMAEMGQHRRTHEADGRREWLPAHQDVGDRSPLDGPIAAEGKAGLAVYVLRVPHVGAVVALVDGHVYSGAFGMRLQGEGKKACRQDVVVRFHKYNVVKTQSALRQATFWD